MYSYDMNENFERQLSLFTNSNVIRLVYCQNLHSDHYHGIVKSVYNNSFPKVLYIYHAITMEESTIKFLSQLFDLYFIQIFFQILYINHKNIRFLSEFGIIS